VKMERNNQSNKKKDRESETSGPKA